MALFVNIVSTSLLINSDSCIDIWAWCGTLSWNGYSWKSIFNAAIHIFLGRLSEYSSFLKSTAVFLQVKIFLFFLSEKVLVSKDAHVLTDALIQSPENVFLVEVKSYWEKFPSLLRKLLPNSLFDFHGGWDPWDDWDDDVDSTLLNVDVVNDLNCLQCASVMRCSFQRTFYHCWSHESFKILPWTLSLS